MNDKDFVKAIIAVTVIFLILTGFIITLALLNQKRRTRYILEMNNLKQVYESELLKSQLEIQEQTFRVISQEIHDNIGQVLSLTKLNLNVMAPQCGYLPLMTNTQMLVTKAITDLRDLCKGLSPERVAEIDLEDSINHELQMLVKTNLYTTDVQKSGMPYSLNKEKKIIMFRIFQEVLNNIVKHANATTINVQLQYDENLFCLMVTDNGQGFQIGEKVNGMGLQNIQNRSSLIGATAQIVSAPATGTKMVLSLPM